MTLKKLKIRDAESVVDSFSQSHAFHVRDPHALIQAAGYLKFLHSKSNKSIYFRGQAKNYPSLQPSLYRGCIRQQAQTIRNVAIRNTIKFFRGVKNNKFKSLDENSVECLLQHYGMKTTWIDLVDNIWVALWFACHRVHSSGKFSEHLHFERRNPDKEGEQAYAYIHLVEVDARTQTAPGVFIGETTEFVDLRSACPSIFLRPHSQHGVLFRARAKAPLRKMDYSAFLVDVIRIRLRDALSWLGAGEMLSVHALFPPPFYDQGYAILLNTDFVHNPLIGSIAHIGA